MKTTIIKASTDSSMLNRKATNILNAAKRLLDLMEDTPSGFLDSNDLGPLYEELIEVIPELDFAIKSGYVTSSKDNYDVIRKEPDMW